MKYWVYEYYDSKIPIEAAFALDIRQMDVQKVFMADSVYEAQTKAHAFAESIELGDGDFYMELIGSFEELPILPIERDSLGGFYNPFEDRYENPDNPEGAGYEDLVSDIQN